MELTRRQVVTMAVGAAGAGALAGCTGDGAVSGSDETTAQASFFVFGDVAEQVAGETATADLLVPIGQHGHGWEPGPSVREDIRNADLLVHGMEGFQPWIDDIRGDLEADGADVTTLDASAGLDLLEAGDHDNGEDDHDDEHDDHDDGHDHGEGMDPHFWMDPLRVKEAVGNVRSGLVDVDGDNADAYAENAERFRGELDDLHGRIAETVDDASTDVILVAGHDSLQYFGDRYGVDIEALSGVSPDDSPSLQDIERAQSIIAEHDLAYVCADPLESQEAAEQFVAETDAEEVLPLTAMPGLTDGWEEKGWGYVEVMENVNLPTLERALGA